MTISEGGKGGKLCLEIGMKQSLEELQNRIDKMRKSGRPVPLVLEAAIIKMQHGKGPRLPAYARKGFIKDSR